MTRCIIISLALNLVTFAALAENSNRSEPTVHGVFGGDEMYTLLEPDAIPAIDDPVYLTGAEAAAQMSDDEHVMGLAHGDGPASEAVCWSTWQLDHHEIVNTEFRGTAIAATW
jgi:hypothetical protein